MLHDFGLTKEASLLSWLLCAPCPSRSRAVRCCLISLSGVVEWGAYITYPHSLLAPASPPPTAHAARHSWQSAPCWYKNSVSLMVSQNKIFLRRCRGPSIADAIYLSKPTSAKTMQQQPSERRRRKGEKMKSSLTITYTKPGIHEDGLFATEDWTSISVCPCAAEQHLG